MVWNTTQSAFYKAIDAFNSGERIGEDQDDLCDRKCPCENSENSPPKDIPKSPENSGNNGENMSECRCRRCPACRAGSPSLLSRLFSDNDMLLIAGLILILSQQNADRKLILALAFVLLT